MIRISLYPIAQMWNSYLDDVLFMPAILDDFMSQSKLITKLKVPFRLEFQGSCDSL